MNEEQSVDGGGFPASGTDQAEPNESWQLDVTQMNRIHIAIVRGDTVDEYIRSYRIPAHGAPEVVEYWNALAQKLLSVQLPPGHYWDVPSD